MNPHANDHAHVAVVAIGRNEGERAMLCLTSAIRLLGDASRVIYVDSGSTDGSPEHARRLGVRVVDLDMSKPFTAARARNEGLTHVPPGAEFVQFVDADCEIVDGWMSAAVTALRADTGLAGVAGRRRERFPGQSRYNTLCDMEWDTPVGEADAVGGDAMFRRDALDAVGGYDATMIAGEEPEMCLRMRRLGWRLRRLDAEMTLHDAAMTRFGQWWARNRRAGHAYAETFHRHPPTGAKQVRSNDVLGGIVPLAVAGLAALAVAAGLAVAFAPYALRATLLYAVAAAAVVVLLAGAGYAVLALKVARGRMRRGDPWRRAWLYGRYTVLGKVAQAQGQRRFRRNRRRGVRGGLIEYK